MKSTQILVTPEDLQAFSSTFVQVASEIEQLLNRLQQSVNNLDWEAATKPRVEALVSEMVKKGRAPVQQAKELHNSLVSTAQKFLTADQAGVSAIAGVSKVFSDWQLFYKGSVSTLNQIRDDSWFELEEKRGWHDRFKDLGDLKKQIENEDGSFQDPLRRIFYLDSKIESLQRERDDLIQQSNNILNIFKNDELNAEIAKLDTEMARLGQIKDDYGKYYLLNNMIKNGSTYSPIKGEDVPAFNNVINNNYFRDDGKGLKSNCTWYAAAAVFAATGIELPKLHDAGDWATNATEYAAKNPGGIISRVDSIPEAGSVLCNESKGHVQYVESVHLSPDGKKWEVTVSEESYPDMSGPSIKLADPAGASVGRWRRTISLEIDPNSNPPSVKDSSTQFIHINDSVIDDRQPPVGPSYA